jgi:hypothetical protein
MNAKAAWMLRAVPRLAGLALMVFALSGCVVVPVRYHPYYGYYR